MKKFLITLMILFVFTVYYDVGGARTQATGNWLQFSENGIFLSDEPSKETLEIPVALQTTKKNRKADPEYNRHAIYVPANFKLFVPYNSLYKVERN